MPLRGASAYSSRSRERALGAMLVGSVSPSVRPPLRRVPTSSKAARGPQGTSVRLAAPDETSQRGWNLFARVLQEILVAHGVGLGHLDDRANIHPEKVRRLQRSLQAPKSFPVLNIEEMEQVITVFRLNRQEKVRLRAAILATSVEETLMDRI